MCHDKGLLEPEVERKLRAAWSTEEDRARARAALSRYGLEPYEREVERVRLAIIKLGEGTLDELLRMTEAAKRDYRDVLMWAEYPQEGKARNPVSMSSAQGTTNRYEPEVPKTRERLCASGRV